MTPSIIALAPTPSGITDLLRDDFASIQWRSTTARLSDKDGEMGAVLSGGGLLKYKTGLAPAIPAKLVNGQTFLPEEQIGHDKVSAKILNGHRNLYFEAEVEKGLWARKKIADEDVSHQVQKWGKMSSHAQESMERTVEALLRAQKTALYTALPLEALFARRLDDLEGLSAALTVWGQIRQALLGTSSKSQRSGPSLLTALSSDLKAGRQITTAAHKKEFMQLTDLYFEEKVTHVPRYEYLTAGSEPPLRWIPLTYSHKCGGMPGVPQDKLPDWEFPPEPQGPTTSDFLVDEAVVDSYISRLTVKGGRSIIADRLLPIFRTFVDEIESVRNRLSGRPYTEEQTELRQLRTRRLYQQLAASLERFDGESEHCLKLWDRMIQRHVEGIAQSGHALTDDQQKALWLIPAQTTLSESKALRTGRKLIRSAAKRLQPWSVHEQRNVFSDKLQFTFDRDLVSLAKMVKSFVAKTHGARYMNHTYTLGDLFAEIKVHNAACAEDMKSTGSLTSRGSSEVTSEEPRLVDRQPGEDVDKAGKSESGISHEQDGRRESVSKAPGGESHDNHSLWHNGPEEALEPMEAMETEAYDPSAIPSQIVARYEQPETVDPKYKEDPFDWNQAGLSIQPTHEALAFISFGDFNSRLHFGRTDVACEAECVEVAIYPAAWGRE